MKKIRSVAQHLYEWLLYHRPTIILIFLLLIGLGFSFRSTRDFILDIIAKDKALFWSIFSGITGAFITGVFAWAQMLSTQKQSLIESYNHRFCNDMTIGRVNRYIMERIVYKQPERECVSRPSDYEIEIYYRFFEELELSIERGLISRNDAKNLFTFYAIQGIDNHLLEDFKQITSPESDWLILERLYNYMK